MVNPIEVQQLDNFLNYMISVESLAEDDSEEYLQEIFEIDSKIEELMEYRQYQKMNSIECNVEYLDLIKEHSSGESLKDVITFNKSRILIAIKQFIADLIQLVLEFFQIGFVQKKIILNIYKQLKKYRLDLIKRFTNRIETKGYYDFGEHSIEVEHPVGTIFQPLMSLIMSSLILSLDFKPVIDKVQTFYSNKGRSSPKGEFAEAFLSNDPKIVSDMEKVFNGMMDIMIVAAKSEFINAAMADKSMIEITYEIPKHLVSSIPELGLDEVVYNSKVSIDRIKEIRKLMPTGGLPTDPKVILNILSVPKDLNIGELYSRTAASMGFRDYLDYDKGYKELHICSRIMGMNDEKGSYLFDLFNNNSNLRDLIKEEADNYASEAEDIRSELNSETDILDISNNFYFRDYIATLAMAETFAEAAKRLDIKRSLDETKKLLDNAQRTIYKVDPLLLSHLEEKYSLTAALTTVSYQYSTAKSSLNKFIRVVTNKIDGGLTDIKRVESIIA